MTSGATIDTALPDERVRRAHALRMLGTSWPEIAEELGYSNASTAQVTVRRYLQRSAVLLDAEDRRMMLDLELDRLDLLQAALWGQAMSGDLAAVNAMLKIMKARNDLLGLDQAPTEHTPMLVVPSDRYVETLREYVEGTESQD